MSFARLTACLLVCIVALLPAAARANQSFNAGRRPPHLLSFKHSFGSPSDPVVVMRDSTSEPLVRPTLSVDHESQPACDEIVPPSPVVTPPDALRAPPVRPLA